MVDPLQHTQTEAEAGDDSFVLGRVIVIFIFIASQFHEKIGLPAVLDLLGWILLGIVER
jgi:hypothetical protein